MTMTSRTGCIAAAALAALLALANSAWAEGIVIVNAEYRIALVARGGGSRGWAGQGVAAGFPLANAPVRIDIMDGGELGNGLYFVGGWLPDWPGWFFMATVDPVTGEYADDFVYGLGLIWPTPRGTASVHFLP
jgi:hypothetical protein